MFDGVGEGGGGRRAKAICYLQTKGR